MFPRTFDGKLLETISKYDEDLPTTNFLFGAGRIATKEFDWKEIRNLWVWGDGKSCVVQYSAFIHNVVGDEFTDSTAIQICIVLESGLG